MRYVIYGAGAIGAGIGGMLHRSGREVVLIARGSHLVALQTHGLQLNTPDESRTLQIPTVGSPTEVSWAQGDVVLLAMKAQDTTAALDVLHRATSQELPVVCAQNGVENERLALRRHQAVYGLCVVMPATHLIPGAVDIECAPVSGVLEIGRCPSGVDARAREIAHDLSGAGFACRAVPDVMGWKYAKLLLNLGNAVDAACGVTPESQVLCDRAVAEAQACLEVAGIIAIPQEQMASRRNALSPVRPVMGRERGGSSTSQSLMRSSGSVETDYLNGEIVLLGRLHGVPTPVNALMSETLARMAREQLPPQSMRLEDLMRELAVAEA